MSVGRGVEIPLRAGRGAVMLGAMNLSNDSYVIHLDVGRGSERYYRDAKGWLKVSTRGRKFRATAEQVLNHLLPALAGLKPVGVRVEHREERRVSPRVRGRAAGRT